jgi:hypothetical protein
MHVDCVTGRQESSLASNEPNYSWHAFESSVDPSIARKVYSDPTKQSSASDRRVERERESMAVAGGGCVDVRARNCRGFVFPGRATERIAGECLSKHYCSLFVLPSEGVKV